MYRHSPSAKARAEPYYERKNGRRFAHFPELSAGSARNGVQVVGGSNPPGPTKKAQLQVVSRDDHLTHWHRVPHTGHDRGAFGGEEAVQGSGAGSGLGACRRGTLAGRVARPQRDRSGRRHRAFRHRPPETRFFLRYIGTTRSSSCVVSGTTRPGRTAAGMNECGNHVAPAHSVTVQDRLESAGAKAGVSDGPAR